MDNEAAVNTSESFMLVSTIFSRRKFSTSPTSHIMVLLVSLMMAACTSIEPQESREGAIAINQIITTDNNTEQVVEGLVSSAGNSGDRDIENILLDPISTEPASVQPVEPAVAMTANRVVELEINDYLQNRRNLLKIWIERGRIWFPMVETIFAEEGIPDELKYLALGESSLNPTARSYVGAAGMWQFMPATARSEGLRVDSWIDERRDPELSTRAAAKHLKTLYESYSGNWHLALAGYNCSYRCITRAVNRAGGSINNPPSFWEIYPYLPQQTRNFIPKFIAAALLVSDPERYGIQVDDLGQEYTYDIVLINGMLSLESAAELAGVDVATIRSLNPSVRKATLPANAEAFPLKIPAGSYQNFISAFASLPDDEKVAPTEYTIRSGDTLDSIARRFETTVVELQAVNNIRNHLIFPEQVVMIPGRGVNTNISLATNTNVMQLMHYGDAIYRPIRLAEGFQLVEQAGSTPDNLLMAVSLSNDIVDDLVVPTIYKVRRGDTLGQIADRFDISVRNIQSWNNIRGTTIYANQELTLHTAASAPNPQLYKVRRGDNLAAIARRFGLTVTSLKRLNGLNSDLIFAGQDLQLN
ncbi:MAG: lytic transglycosylase [SAR86 cluster bacterium]|uniref:Lytic transglycosylase n=1 Tax=SAR86 cluster bacterium TaxID=2030880 RepID=A0A2A5CD83_9GAMM|nr:LysM peptidoglycan-binding domain-containing protein [Gammaproteobacteria bacterium AH-315-E17]PCJ41732.1 MAG: lytic transglycosylase [SAR86 cluster bacterium]